MTAQISTLPAAYNQIGQKLGRKGQETRERILSAMLRLLEDESGPPVTLTGVANEASVRLTNLYLYFPNMSELVLAALGRVMETAEAAYVGGLRARWPDDRLEEACLAFLRTHHDFWKLHARLLHLRNALADASDLPILHYRNAVTRPLIDLLAAQMDHVPGAGEDRCLHVSTVLMTCLERVATVVTNQHFSLMLGKGDGTDHSDYVDKLIEAEAEVIALVITQRRGKCRGMRE